VDIIFGFPQETFGDRIETIKFMQEIIKWAQNHTCIIFYLCQGVLFKKNACSFRKRNFKNLRPMGSREKNLWLLA